MDNCRLCGGSVSHAFNKLLLFKHDVAFYKCNQCLSLQTEPPYWLNESYADPRPILDVGMVQRTIQLWLATNMIFDIMNIPKKTIGLDWGGGNGLFCRMMRDSGYDFYNLEPWVENFYVPFHTYDQMESLNKAPAIITIFEVLEHLETPGIDLNEIFSMDADLFLTSTEVYLNQGSDWGYLAAEGGQHIFFYSPQALDLIANNFNYQLITTTISNRLCLQLFYRTNPKYLNYDKTIIEKVVNILSNQSLLLNNMLQYMVNHLCNPFQYLEDDCYAIFHQIAPSK